MLGLRNGHILETINASQSRYNLLLIFDTNQSLVFLENLADGAMKDEALEFLKEDKLHQCLRNEIQYGLIPKTAKEGNH